MGLMIKIIMVRARAGVVGRDTKLSVSLTIVLIPPLLIHSPSPRFILHIHTLFAPPIIPWGGSGT